MPYTELSMQTVLERNEISENAQAGIFTQNSMQGNVQIISNIIRDNKGEGAYFSEPIRGSFDFIGIRRTNNSTGLVLNNSTMGELKLIANIVSCSTVWRVGIYLSKVTPCNWY